MTILLRIFIELRLLIVSVVIFYPVHERTVVARSNIIIATTMFIEIFAIVVLCKCSFIVLSLIQNLLLQVTVKSMGSSVINILIFKILIFLIHVGFLR